VVQVNGSVVLDSSAGAGVPQKSQVVGSLTGASLRPDHRPPTGRPWRARDHGSPGPPPPRAAPAARGCRAVAARCQSERARASIASWEARSARRESRRLITT
jgi:hypothetical protein